MMTQEKKLTVNDLMAMGKVSGTLIAGGDFKIKAHGPHCIAQSNLNKDGCWVSYEPITVGYHVEVEAKAKYDDRGFLVKVDTLREVFTSERDTTMSLERLTTHFVQKTMHAVLRENPNAELTRVKVTLMGSGEFACEWKLA